MVVLVAIVFLSGCYYDVEEELYPYTGNCDTTSVSYSASILPILQINGCLGCHTGGAPSGNISLENYISVKAVAQSGRLMGSVSHAGGYTPMPQGGNKLSACSINKLRAWIDAGMPEN